MARKRIVIAGASGFIGQRLTDALRDEHDVIALSRKEQRARAGVEHRKCDLFSLIDVERGVVDAEYAFYLAHSMMPSARLTQGAFNDFDLIAADNFGRACARAGVKQIVYLGGLVPDGETLSPHLRSRLEVEKALGAHGVPVTALRASLVLGAGGSSFLILLRLVRRLPVMLCPRWTLTPTQPIALSDVVRLLKFCLGNVATYAQNFDVGAPQITTYRDLMERTARVLGLKRYFFSVPAGSPHFSRLWVTLITGAPKALVAPLVESLKTPMVCRDRRLQAMEGRAALTLDQALVEALKQDSEKLPTPIAFKPRSSSETRVNDVRSAQRLPLPPGRDADWIAHEYAAVLPRLMLSAVRTEVDDDGLCSFYVRGTKLLLLQMRLAPERSQPDRQLFYIKGGLLARAIGRGRLEFRSFPDLHVAIAAIHEFRPYLPWYVYRHTQAIVHLWVMRRFGRYLARGWGTQALRG